MADAVTLEVASHARVGDLRFELLNVERGIFSIDARLALTALHS